MRDRGKGVATSYNNSSRRSSCNNNKDDSRMSSSDVVVHCPRHPSSSGSVGICPHCLKDRLTRLVCSECGEQRLSSCSCSSDLSSSNRNSSSSSCATVGRVSFLIYNQKASPNPIDTQPKSPSSLLEDDPSLLRSRSSSSSSCAKPRSSITNSGGGVGFWGIWKLFEKKKKKKKNRTDNKGGGFDEDNGNDEDGNNETWVVGNHIIPRSRSLCSFSSDLSMSLNVGRGSSGASINDMYQARKSTESGKAEAGLDYTKSANRRVFSLRESDRITGDSGFIDLNLGFSAAKGLASTRSYSSCGFADRRKDRERTMSKSRRSTHVWRWIFRGRKRDEDRTIVI